MKTAVEWLEEKMIEVYNIDISKMKNALYLAKEMEKNQIKRCFVDVSIATLKGLNIKNNDNDIEDYKKIAEQYYKENYESKR